MLDRSTVGRRGFIAGAGALAALSTAPVGTRGQPRGNVTRLGDFEDGLDAWQTNGPNELARVTDEEFPAGVAHGSYALSVLTEGDPFAMISNVKRVRRADFEGSPYLTAVAVPIIAGSDAEVEFTFRYRHGGRSRGGGNGGDSGLTEVEVSPPIRATQALPNQLTWDMSGLGDALAEPVSLGLAWHPADQPPETGPTGNGRGEGFNGVAIVDDVRLSDDPADLSTAAMPNTLRDLRLAHGFIVDVVTDQRSETVETGHLVFDDGTEVQFEFEVVGGDRYRYTLGDETFKLGGGW